MTQYNIYPHLDLMGFLRLSLPGSATGNGNGGGGGLLLRVGVPRSEVGGGRRLAGRPRGAGRGGRRRRSAGALCYPDLVVGIHRHLLLQAGENMLLFVTICYLLSAPDLCVAFLDMYV